MIHKIAPLGIFALLCWLPVAALADLKTAKKFYEEGNYPDAIKELEFLLGPDSTPPSQEAEIEIHTLLGASYFRQNSLNKAKSEFDFVLRYNPNTTLDNLKFSEDICKFFEIVKKEFKESQELVYKKSLNRRFGQATSDGLEMILLMEAKTPLYYAISSPIPSLSYVPFVGQVQNGQSGKGALLLGGELFLTGTNVGTFLYLKAVTVPVDGETAICKVEDGVFLTSIERCNAARKANIASGTLAVALLAFSIYDSRRFFLNQIKEPKIQPLPIEYGKKLQKQSQLRLSPLLTPDGTGLGLTGSF